MTNVRTGLYMRVSELGSAKKTFMLLHSPAYRLHLSPDAIRNHCDALADSIGSAGNDGHLILKDHVILHSTWLTSEILISRFRRARC